MSHRLFSRFGLTVLILPFPLVNHFFGANIGFFFRLFVFVGNGKGSQVGSREKLLRSRGCDLGNEKMLVCSLGFFGGIC